MRLTRFLRNPAVTVEEIVATAAARAGERGAGAHVLAIEDTTSVRSEAAGGGGLSLHATILVAAQAGTVLGLADATFLERQGGAKARCRRTPFADKESRRWLEGAEAAQAACPRAARLTVVSDREGDVFETFAFRPTTCGLLIRSAQDRRIGGPAAERLGAAYLSELTAALPEAGRTQVELPAAPGRKARTMTLALRFAAVALQRPVSALPSRRAALPEEVPVFVVEAREVDPPTGQPAASWRLLTTEKVTDAADARRIVGLYRRRWTIEQTFRILKTKGFDVEALRFTEDRPRKVLVTAALVAALTIQQMVYERDGAAQRPLEDAFDPDDQPALEQLNHTLEGATERQKNPHPPGSLAFATWVCARLGGWTGYYGKPGPIVLLRGWMQFLAIKHGWNIAKYNV